ncbi:MAG: TonB-dependent receptor [Burkholderiales bacterium]|nr:TonB-dependent receptor [Bacteroidia bacterium]
MKSTRTYILSKTASSVGVFLLYFFFSVTIYSQQKDTSLHQLPEVSVFQTKQELLQNSKKSVSIDSLTLARYNTTSLADLLSNQSTIHIKTYGNGNMATTSMRGGSSYQTALLWNGLNIQNAMLGMPDLSIVPTLFFDNVTLEYGGGSSLWGSGAIGGSIHLQNKTIFNQGFKTKLQMSTGSFDTKKIATGVLLSYKKIVSNTKIYFTTSENNYNYKDTLDKENPNKQVIHANYTAKGLLQEISAYVSPFQKINIRAWYNSMFRNLPSYTTVASKKNQEDENLKLNADWNYLKRRLSSTIRLGFFNDKLNYTDSASNLYSKSTIKTFIAENDNLISHNNHTFNFGVNFTNYNTILATEENNESENQYHHLSKVAFFLAYKLSLLNSKFSYNIAVRKEFTDQTFIPFTGNTGIHYQLTKLLAAKVNANRSFRQPTLNDLYWKPGGNPNLKPEDSYELEGGLEINYKKNNLALFIEATYFNRHTTNWIMWLPSGNSNWSPQNIAEVYSRGTETRTDLTYLKKDFLFKIIINTSYVLSTNKRNNTENDNSEGRQLIFTPRYNGQGSLMVGYKNFQVQFNNSYTGYRFTASDNTAWLNPYYISNLKFNYSYSFSSVNTQLFCNINNLFNKNYVVISNNPMPMRNYEVGICLNYHKPKKKTENETLIN